MKDMKAGKERRNAGREAGRPPMACAVVITFNSEPNLEYCIPTLAGQDYPGERLKLIIVDNGPSREVTERIAGRYRQADVLRPGINLATAGGANLGILHALRLGADYVFLFNDDMKIGREFIRSIVEAGERNADYGIIAGKLVYMGTNTIQMAGGGWLDAENPLKVDGYGSGREDDGSFDGKPVVMDVVMEGDTGIKRGVFEKVGLFDPAYFTTLEGPDLCLRAGRAGFKCAYVSKARVEHAGAVTTDRRKNRGMPLRLLVKLKLQMAKNGFYFLLKHYPPRVAARAVVRSFEEAVSKLPRHAHLMPTVLFAVGWNAVNLPHTLSLRGKKREDYEGEYAEMLANNPVMPGKMMSHDE